MLFYISLTTYQLGLLPRHRSSTLWALDLSWCIFLVSPKIQLQGFPALMRLCETVTTRAAEALLALTGNIFRPTPTLHVWSSWRATELCVCGECVLH